MNELAKHTCYVVILGALFIIAGILIQKGFKELFVIGLSLFWTSFVLLILVEQWGAN